MEAQPRRAYPTDLNDQQWRRLAPLMSLPLAPLMPFCYKKHMATDGSENTVLQEVSEWRKRGEELRAKLLEEHTILSARLKEIDEALAGIALPQQMTQQAQEEPALIPEDGSASDMVRAVLNKLPGWKSATEIIRDVHTLKPLLHDARIHSAIYRLVKAGKIISHGRKGTKKYRLAGATLTAREDASGLSVKVWGEGQNERGHPRKGLINPDSIAGRAIAVLKDAHSPLHVDEIVARMEANGGKVNKMSLVGALSRFAQKKHFISRADRPNMFGLREG